MFEFGQSLTVATDSIGSRKARIETFLSRPLPYSSELAKSRSVWRAFPSIGEPCDTRMRLSDSISAHLQQLSAQRGRIFDHRHLHDLGDLRFLAGKARHVQQPTAEAGFVPDVADHVVQHERRAVWRANDKRRLAASSKRGATVLTGTVSSTFARAPSGATTSTAG